ncbi:MAG: hypothetical protein Q9P01_14850 [Anaerolineae bacterium]|nr:hypothetical protein [Anaerolineae bacterium]
MTSPKQFYGPNMGYVLELYDRYLEAPDSVDANTAEFFRHWSPDMTMNGGADSIGDASAIDIRKVVGAVEYAQAVRQFGHLAARLDPLGTTIT